MRDLEQFAGFHRTKEFYETHLQPERLQRAYAAYRKIKEELGTSTYPPTLGLLLDEQYETQTVLDLIQANRETPPSGIQAVDQILPPGMLISRDSTAPLVIEVMGPPAIGKTTLIQNAAKDIKEKLWIHEEVAQKAKPATRETEWHIMRYADRYEANKLFENEKLVERIRNAKKTNLTVPTTLADRWLVDNNIFGLARFMHGKIFISRDASGFAAPLHALEEITEFSEENPFALPEDYTNDNEWYIQLGLILCLANPQVSLNRDPNPNEVHEVITPEFLPVLYEQYLRFHAQMLVHRRPFLYAALDVSSDNQEQVQQKFNFTVDKMMHFYNKKRFGFPYQPIE